MKRKLGLLLIICLMFFALAGCANFNTQLENAVSEIHERVLYGKALGFEVTVTIGKIEKDFALDGVKNELKDFIAFRVKPLDGKDYKNLGVSYRYNEQSVEFDMTKSPKYGVWTLRLDGTMNIESLEVVVFDEKNDFIIPTAELDMGDFSPLDKLKEKFKDELMELHSGGKFNCEITMRFVKNYNEQDSKFYWFVVVHTTKKDYFGIMIEPETGDVISQRK